MRSSLRLFATLLIINFNRIFSAEGVCGNATSLFRYRDPVRRLHNVSKSAAPRLLVCRSRSAWGNALLGYLTNYHKALFSGRCVVVVCKSIFVNKRQNPNSPDNTSYFDLLQDPASRKSRDLLGAGTIRFRSGRPLGSQLFVRKKPRKKRKPHGLEPYRLLPAPLHTSTSSGVPKLPSPCARLPYAKSKGLADSPSRQPKKSRVLW